MSKIDHPEAFAVEVQKQDRGWIVVLTADGERKEIEPPHPDREKADFAAKSISSAADRWTGSGSVEDPEPAKYPGDGSSAPT
jgi:hypothetical protein